MKTITERTERKEAIRTELEQRLGAQSMKHFEADVDDVVEYLMERHSVETHPDGDQMRSHISKDPKQQDHPTGHKDVSSGEHANKFHQLIARVFGHAT